MKRKWLLWLGIPAVLALLIAIPLGWYLISPLFINTTVDDAFPVAAAPPSAPSLIEKPSPTPTAVVTPTTIPSAATRAPSSASAATVTGTTAPTVVAVVPTLPPTSTPAPTRPSGPVALRTGQFHPAQHDPGSGTATIFRQPDGTLILRLENLNVLNGPDLYVYLSALPDANDSDQVLQNHYVSLGRLKGNRGNQTYEIPAGTDPGAINSVIVWCQNFRVNFATAPLK